MKKILMIGLGLYSATLFGQDYSVSKLPPTLSKDANVVKRFEELKVTIISPSKAKVRHKYALTILSEAGNDFSDFGSDYDKLHSIDDITGRLFDATGKELKRVKKKDISDMSMDDDMSLMTDNRLKRHSFNYSQYPYTIEYEEEKTQDGIFFLPGWNPVEDEKFSVELSRFVVEFPADYKLRFQQFNYSEKPVSAELGKTKTLTWELKNYAPIKWEYFLPPWQEITPAVNIAPSDFEVGGYKGNMESWQSLGMFINQLNAGKDILPANIKQQVHQLTDGLTSKEEKINKLYEFMQNNTRYISIQLGIGGWQPYDATYVATKKYGDCKALSNYMRSLLTEAGIEANYVLVKAGKSKKGLYEDFPAPYFNHAIMCVPDGKDTLWLECTSQTESAGFMGSFTGNRQALMIKNDGGYVVRTPVYTAMDNKQLRKIEAVIDEAGNLKADVRTVCTGVQQERLHSLIHGASKTQREKYLNNAISLATYEVVKNDYKEVKGKNPKVEEQLQITSPHFASITGKRLFVVPNMFNKSSFKLPTDDPRKFDIKVPYEFVDIDTIQIILPEGYVAEAVPSNVKIKNKFGEFSVDYSVSNNKIEVIRKEQASGTNFPASDYKDLADYYEQKYKADRAKIVLVKKD